MAHSINAARKQFQAPQIAPNISMKIASMNWDDVCQASPISKSLNPLSYFSHPKRYISIWGEKVFLSWRWRLSCWVAWAWITGDHLQHKFKAEFVKGKSQVLIYWTVSTILLMVFFRPHLEISSSIKSAFEWIYQPMKTIEHHLFKSHYPYFTIDAQLQICVFKLIF
jgi:hypothetical protein